MAAAQKRGPVQRISGIDASATEDVLKAAMHLMVPEDQTQRQAFVPLMPHLYVLRRKGCSWAQLTKLLTDCGFNLLPSTVRSYYSEELAVRQDLCEARLAESLVVIAETKKAANSADMAAIAERVSTASARTKAAAAAKMDAVFGTSQAGGKNAAPAGTEGQAASGAAKLDAIFGSGGAGAPRRQSPPLEAAPGVQEAAEPPLAENKNTGLCPVVEDQSRKPDTSNANPVIPVLKQKLAASPPLDQNNGSSPSLSPRLLCQALQAGVTPLEMRQTVPSEVYQPGMLEHPAIAGLLLSLEERLYGAALEYVDTSDGVIKLEDVKEKRFRVMWTKPIPMTVTNTGSNFTKMRKNL